MKKQILLTVALAAFMLMAFTSKKLHTDIYKVDTKLSSLEWYAEKVSGKHNGIIMLSGGTISNDHGNLSATFEIDMTSIACTDLTGEYKTKLENHLKSDDFFGSAKYPKAKFTTTSITPLKNVKAEGFTHAVKGNLTIKDKTNEISFDAVIKMEGAKIACTGTAVVDRSKFDVKYGSKTFFPDIADKMIYDEFKLKFNIIAQ
ncbi:MAG: YceI family protein [Bacteroidota bacterium]